MFYLDKKSGQKRSVDSTIAAISTPQGSGALGIVRMSGNKALEIADKVFKGKEGLSIQKAGSHSVLYGNIISSPKGNVIDEVLMIIMRAPKTYTTEDTVEISAHGGMYSLRRILEVLIENGADHAEPGEFTKRAFLNGRLDLSQAESVIDVINSETELGLELAVNHLKGSLSKRIRAINDKILEFYSEIEADIDFPEDIDKETDPEVFVRNIELARKDLAALLSSSADGRKLRKGINLVIAGKTNVGKSSLFNILLKENRSIVTNVHGTTRNTLEASVVLKGSLYKIFDTAGLRKPRGMVEDIGIMQSKDRIREADIILYLVSNNAGMTKEDRKYIEETDRSKLILVINKADLPEKINIPKGENKPDAVKISAKKNDGIDSLIDLIAKKTANIFPKSIYKCDCLINERQHDALTRADKSLQDASKAIKDKMSLEFIAFDIKSALNAIGEITGDDITEDTLNSIFSRFCIGK